MSTSVLNAVHMLIRVVIASVFARARDERLCALLRGDLHEPCGWIFWYRGWRETLEII